VGIFARAIGKRRDPQLFGKGELTKGNELSNAHKLENGRKALPRTESQLEQSGS